MENEFFHGYMGMDVDEIATVIYLKRAFQALECPHPNEDVAVFSSCLDEMLLDMENGKLRRRMKQSVHLLFHYHVTQLESESSEACKVASGSVAMLLLDAFSAVLEYHDDDDILLSLEECMHDLKSFIFHSRPAEDTASIMLSSSMHMATYLRSLGRDDDAYGYLLSDLSAPDYLYRNGLLDGDSFLPVLGALHIMRGMEIESEYAGMGLEDLIIGGAIFKKVGADACKPYMDLVEACEERLCISLF